MRPAPLRAQEDANGKHNHEVYRKIKGWRKSPLGLLYYPNYIYARIAIHGNPSVPPYPASHGCIRIPMFAAKEFSAIAKIGMVVIVYANNLLYETERRSPYGVRGKSIDLFRDWKSKSAPIASWNELTWPIVDKAVQ